MEQANHSLTYSYHRIQSLSLGPPKFEPDLVMIEEKAIVGPFPNVLEPQTREPLRALFASQSRAKLDVVRHEDPTLDGPKPIGQPLEPDPDEAIGHVEKHRARVDQIVNDPRPELGEIHVLASDDQRPLVEQALRWKLVPERRH